MPIADFVCHIGAVAGDRDAAQAVMGSFADAAALRAYAEAHGIALSEAEVLTLVEAVRSLAPVGRQALSESDLDAVSGAGMPEGLSRSYDIVSTSIAPKMVVPPRLS